MLSLIALVVAATVAPPGLTEAGVRAAEERRYCDASAIFVQLHGLSRDPLALYRAAETAFAAGDYLAAVRLYRTLLDNHPGFERTSIVETRVAELLLRVRDGGQGTACALPPRICGDWIMSAGEGCDDGNIIDGDGCDATCMPTGCGNGQRTADEVCDDGNATNGDGCDANCTVSVCGNGAVAPGEVCDDGNSVDGDGCDSNCSMSVCGNGIRASGEGCDDGNVENGDGCDSSCAVEAPSRPFPWGGVAVGSAVTVAGIVGVVVGTLPLQAHADARDAVLAAEDLAPANPDVALDRATTAQQAQDRAQQDWNTWGITAVAVGTACALVGVGVVVGALLFGAMPVDDGDVAPPPPTPPTPPTAGPPAGSTP